MSMTIEERRAVIEKAAKAAYTRHGGRWQGLTMGELIDLLADQEAALLAIGHIEPLPAKTRGEEIAERLISTERTTVDQWATLEDGHGRKSRMFKPPTDQGNVTAWVDPIRRTLARILDDALAAERTACAERADEALAGCNDPDRYPTGYRAVVRAAILNAPK